MNRLPPLRRLALGVAAVCAIALPVRAQPALEYDVKAALLLNFARFIEWPDGVFAGPRDPLEICVFSPNPFGDALERVLQSESVGSRPLSSRTVRNAAESAGCHLLYVPAGSEAAALSHAGPYTITVGESRRFEQMGGAVTLVVDHGRIRFNVNLRPVEQRGVRISARMLKLAGKVERATPEK